MPVPAPPVMKMVVYGASSYALTKATGCNEGKREGFYFLVLGFHAPGRTHEMVKQRIRRQTRHHTRTHTHNQTQRDVQQQQRRPTTPHTPGNRLKFIELEHAHTHTDIHMGARTHPTSVTAPNNSKHSWTVQRENTLIQNTDGQHTHGYGPPRDKRGTPSPTPKNTNASAVQHRHTGGETSQGPSATRTTHWRNRVLCEFARDQRHGLTIPRKPQVRHTPQAVTARHHRQDHKQPP